MHLTVRAGVVIFLLSVAAIAGSKTGIVWDAGGVTGRDVWSARGNGKRAKLRTGRDDADATLLTVSPNGRRMAWWLIPPGQTARRDLVVARTAGGRGRNVTAELDGKVVAAKFTGDSKHLLFVFEDAATGRADLWRANARGKGLRNLTSGLEGDATGTLRVSPCGAAALVEWELADRIGLVLLDVKRGVPSILQTGLPDGEPGGYAFWPEEGVLHFTWREDGAEKDDLWQLDDTELALACAGLDSVRGIPPSASVAVRGPQLHLVGAGSSTTLTAPGRIVTFSWWPRTGFPVVAVEEDARLRVLQIDSDDDVVDLLPDREIEEVEEIRVLPDGKGVVIAVREEGLRRLYYVHPTGVKLHGDEYPVDLAEGLEGRVGAFRTVLPDGTVIFSTVAAHGSAGGLFAWTSPSDRVALIARTGLVGLPGRAVVSPRTGRVLFNVIAMPEADNRVFLWDRKKDEVRPLTPEFQRPGTFLFTR